MDRIGCAAKTASVVSPPFTQPHEEPVIEGINPDTGHIESPTELVSGLSGWSGINWGFPSEIFVAEFCLFC